MSEPTDAVTNLDSLRVELATFLDLIDRPAVVEDIRAEIGGTGDDVRRRLDMYLNEAFVALDLVAPHLDGVSRILEVGAGLGVFSSFLATRGFEVVAIEPAATGFDFMGPARRALDAHLPATDRVFLALDANDLTADHGLFDLAFSVHVLEHVDDVGRVVQSVQARVGRSGRSVHICPNYAVPYDPHFGVPLVPVRPQLTSRLLPDRIRSSGLWQSLNFITARRVRAVALAQGLAVSFRGEVMSDAALRVCTDATFRARHRRLGAIAEFIVRRRAGRWVLTNWPPTMATPMTFTLTAT